MSATGRNKNVREKDDFYRTPEWATLAILKYLTTPITKARSTGKPGKLYRVLDPACGDGAILDVAAHYNARTIGIELNPGRAEVAVRRGHKVTCSESLSAEWPECDLILANPPYKLAEEFVWRAIQELTMGRTKEVAMLLRLEFLSSITRSAFHRQNVGDVYPHACRPSFLPSGATDSCEYAWFAFGAEHDGRIRILYENDPARRRAKQPKLIR